jgi:hypothetical protein
MPEIFWYFILMEDKRFVTEGLYETIGCVCSQVRVRDRACHKYSPISGQLKKACKS